MPQPADKVLVIACGALARELHQIRLLNGWTHMHMRAIDAALHFQPIKIAPAVRASLEATQGQYAKTFVAFADCGTYGALDSVLNDYDVERLPGLHCYATFAGQAEFDRLHSQEPGTFYLTDFLVRHFERFVVKALKLDEHPELKQQFFGNYSQALYLQQTPTPELICKAREIALYLELDYREVNTAFGELVPQLESFMEARHASG